VILGYSRSQPAHPVITIPHNLIVIQTTSHSHQSRQACR